MSRKECLKRELRAIQAAIWPDTVERISIGLTLSQTELDALLRANEANLPEPKFPVLGIEQSQAFFDCVGIGA